MDDHPTRSGGATTASRFDLADAISILTGIVRGRRAFGNPELRGLGGAEFDRNVVHEQILADSMPRDEQDVFREDIESLLAAQFHCGQKRAEPSVVPVDVCSIFGIILDDHFKVSTSIIIVLTIRHGCGHGRARTVGGVAHHFHRGARGHPHGHGPGHEQH